ncbi:cyclic AMP receptor-like protein A isoform X2 [Littorina saxatilis]|uniref:G-protein coupled receptors family 2 profile 2 domain-containing protein n=1 Tax=Littorina saxatilis TaxID=31220 RepID=A0AAN9ANH2_9CAEN
MAQNESVLTQSTCSISEDQSECDTVITIRIVFASFSLIACLFMIVVIWLFRKFVVFAQRLILYLSIGAFCDSIAYLMSSSIEDGPLCDFQAWWLTYFDWTVLLWVSCLTFNLYMNVIQTRTTEQWEKGYHAVCWGVPLIMSTLPFIGDHYGPAGVWCWITEDIAWRLGIWYVPLFIIIGLLFFAYIYIFCMLRRRASSWEGTYDPDTERNHRMLKEDIKPLQFYPFVYLIVSVFPLINRINSAVNPGHDKLWMVVAASISAPLHGVLNAIVFGMDKETMQRLTPSQIKMAWVARNHQQEVREYPLAIGHPEDLEATADKSKFRSVAYSRLH